MKTHRRKLLIGTTVSLALAGVWWWRTGEGRFVRNPSGLGSEVDLWLASSPTLLALGSHLPAAEAETLTKALRASLKLEHEGAVPLVLLQQSAQAAIAESFASDELEIIDGWLLAPVELLLGQLAVVVSDGRAAADVRDDPQPWQAGEIAALENWGPQSTEVDTPFNLQSDGHCGLWFRLRGAPPWARIVIDGEEMPTAVQEDTVTSGLFGSLQSRVLATPGRYGVELVDPMKRVRQAIGDFVVTPRPERWRREDGSDSAVFCPVREWGPNLTLAGEVPNPQPDGSSGLWFKLECAPAQTMVELDGELLPAASQPGLLTARVDAALYARAGGHQLNLYDPDSGERMPVGLLRVLPKMN